MLKALAASLLVHVAVLAVPPGTLGLGPGNSDAAGRPGPRDAAPLNVLLGPAALELPRPSAPPIEADAPRPGSTAQAVDSQGTGKGHFGDEARAAAELPTPPPLALAVSPSIRYYPPLELSRRARILRDIDPNLGDLEDTPGSGKALVVLWINERGGVDRVETERSTLEAAFEAAVIAQFRQSRFLPAERGGAPVKSLMKIEVEVVPRSRYGRVARDVQSSAPDPATARE